MEKYELEIKNLNLSIGNNSILENINLKIKKGEIHCLIGPNGGGKSSLIKCILKELLCNKKRKGDKHILRKFKGECCNNHFNCFYRKEGRCECGKERVAEILKSFEERNIVKKQGGLYQVQL